MYIRNHSLDGRMRNGKARVWGKEKRWRDINQSWRASKAKMLQWRKNGYEEYEE